MELKPVIDMNARDDAHIMTFFGTEYQKMILRDNPVLREELAEAISNCVFDDHQIILRIRIKDAQSYLDCIINTNDSFEFNDLVYLPDGGYLPIETYQNDTGYEIKTYKLTFVAEEVKDGSN